MTKRDLVDADIARASTIPSRVYCDESMFRHLREALFAKTWQPVRDTADLRTAGRVAPFTLLEGCLDEPLVLTRDDRDVVRCLSNVCTHRGGLVAQGDGQASSLRCRYHGRRFGLDGCFRSMPEFQGVEDFPSAADDLPQLPLAEWGPLYFACLGSDPVCGFEQWVAPVVERTAWLRPDRFRLDPARSEEYAVEANWALYCENYLEGFHIPYVHRTSLAGALDRHAYTTHLFDWGSLQIGRPAGGGGPAFAPPEGHPDHGQRVAGWYFWLFPNVMLNFYPWGLSLNVVQPVGARRTRVVFRSYVGDPSRLGEGAGADLHRVEKEDEEIVEEVQRGVASRLYDRGRYSAARERGTHHFHRLLERFL